MTDLFGNEEYKHAGNGKKGRNANPKGYAARPGSGPAGETCKSCLHYCRVKWKAGTHLKCGLLKWRWTHCPGTDIRAGSPACRYWEPDWNVTEHNGLMIRAHSNYEPEFSKDGGKTWEKLKQKPQTSADTLQPSPP